MNFSPRTIILSLLLLFAPALGAQPSFPLPIAEIDRIVAVVNDEVIVASELNERIRQIMAELQQTGRSATPPMDALKKQVLDRLILDRLQIQVARRIGIKVDDQQLNRTLVGIARKNNLDPRRFREILERDGYDFGAFRDDIRNQLIITEVQKRQVANRVQVTDREIDNYLSAQSGKKDAGISYRLAHILVSVRDSTDAGEVAGARKKADDVIRRLHGGADFAEMAITVSDGQQALEGGDLGWRNKEQLPGLFADTVPGMTPGDVSEPLWDSSGFHIVKLMDLRGQKRHMVMQMKARHVLVRTDEMTSDADAKTRLRQIRERIIQGESFEELARSHSDDRGTAIKGGNLGWVGMGDVVPNFAREMEKLPPMEISEPFRTQFGWHIVQVLERRKHDGTEEVRRSAATNEIRERKIQEELDIWLRQLRDEAYVEYRLDEG